MPRYIAFLRGVSPLNAKMADLKLTFEAVGFTDVKSVLSSGNVAFSAPAMSETTLARRAEAAMAERLGRSFYTIVRRASALCHLAESDPYAAFDLPANARRIVTFLGTPYLGQLSLPFEKGDVRILALHGREVLSAYTPAQLGAPVLLLIEKTFGSNVTTRTWETVKKCAWA